MLYVVYFPVSGLRGYPILPKYFKIQQKTLVLVHVSRWLYCTLSALFLQNLYYLLQIKNSSGVFMCVHTYAHIVSISVYICDVYATFED